MTQKELLYVEDAIGHEQNIIEICNNMINDFSDDNLISFMKKQVRKHTNMLELLLNILGDKTNE